MLLVTAYLNPDLDGTAAAFAYAEFLTKTQKPATAVVFGTHHREAQFVLDFLHLETLQDGNKLFASDSSIILTDASDPIGISPQINPDQIIEIIDHRIVNQSDQFTNAKSQIELVGAAATLIAEKYKHQSIPISRESAALLYAAIISNTINFQATVTTDRDRAIAEWLLPQAKLPADFIHRMFVHKSTFTQSLKEIIAGDFATFDFSGHALGIAQLEIIDVNEFITNQLDHIKAILLDLKTKKQLDYIFLTCIDIEQAFNQFVVVDSASQTLVETALAVKFDQSVATRPGIIMRKQIIPLIKDILDHRPNPKI